CMVMPWSTTSTMHEAVDHPRFHHQWLPDQVSIEDGAFKAATWQAMREKGHYICLRSAIGRVDAILVRPDGKVEGAADPRRDDQAMGF
ncbi:MAG: gamma-glutamyltransferase, partial [Bacteroidota bacterium]